MAKKSAKFDPDSMSINSIHSEELNNSKAPNKTSQKTD